MSNEGSLKYEFVVILVAVLEVSTAGLGTTEDTALRLVLETKVALFVWEVDDDGMDVVVYIEGGE